MTGLASLGTESAEVAPRGRVRHVPGEVGLWIVLFGDMTFFLLLFGAYLHARGQHKELFATSQDALNPTLGAVNTLVLLTSSLLVVFATRAVRSERQGTASRLALAGALVGSCFVAIKAVEYGTKVSAGLLPTTNEFFMFYYMLTGLHLVHVCIGLAILLILSRVTRRGELSATHVKFFEGGACFWHMVDLLWLLIFPILFLAR